MFLTSCSGLAICVLVVASAVHSALVKHNLTITWEPGAPNGQSRYMSKTNGQFPAPALWFAEDDVVEITVYNQMPFGTSVHWHGLLMQGTPWSDGAPGVTQQSIEPGKSYVYRFKANPPGTYWYHAHSRGTLMDGLYGALYIKPKNGSPTPWSMISADHSDIQAMSQAAASPYLLLVSDWSRFSSSAYMDAEYTSVLNIFCTDSILVNGKGSVFCPGKDYLVSKTSAYMANALAPETVNDKGCFPFVNSTQGRLYLPRGKPSLVPPHIQSGCEPSTGASEVIEVDGASKWVSLNFISASTLKTIIFQVDEHKMWVYEVDGQYIEPRLVDTVNMYAGERYSVMIRLDKKPGDYTIRIADNGLSQIISTLATMRYKNGTDIGPTTGYIDYGGQPLNSGVVALNRSHLPPFPNIAPSPTADAEHLLLLSRFNASFLYTVTGKAMYPMDREKLLPYLYAPDSPDANDTDLVVRTINGTWVDLILQVGHLKQEPQAFPHMMHKHSSRTWQIGAGVGIWNYSSVAQAIKAQPSSFNLVDPNYRDTFTTSFDGPSWIVLRYQVTNPGPWMFHCHIETHLMGGMAMVIMDGVDKWPRVPPEYAIDQLGHPPREQGY